MVPAGKTPISYLQELCNKNGTTAQYDVLANEGTSVHQPEFVMQVAVGENLATGRGSSKKKAKHAAALSLLQKISGHDMGSEQSNGSVDENGPSGENVGGQNPIGELQEFSQKNHLKPPEFEYTESKGGPPTDVEFACECHFAKHVEKGIGASKKSAKRNAALAMLAFIKGLESVKSEVAQDDEEEEEDLQLIIEVKNRIDLARKKWKNLPVSNNTTAEEIKKFYSKIMASGRQKQLSQQGIDGSLNFVRTLQDIAHSQSFELRYIDLPDSKAGMCQCLLQLSTLPVAVVQGTGGTPEEARSNAAYNALLYLRVMLRDL